MYSTQLNTPRLDEVPEARAALALARRHHAGQQRSDGAPFIWHPIEVAALLYYAGAPDHVIAAGLLHDVIEKTSVDAAQLRRHFGDRVAAIVSAVSEDVTVSGYEARKAALRRKVTSAGEEALTVFAADKISKARELRLMPPRSVGPRKPSGRRERQRQLTHYKRSLELLERLLTDSPLVKHLHAELDELTRTYGRGYGDLNQIWTRPPSRWRDGR